jgi:hypothetical protein
MHRELADEVGMRGSQAQAIPRLADIRLRLIEQWVMSDLGPDFDAQVCGLYLDPPEVALVLALDEKTAIQTKAPARPDEQSHAEGGPARARIQKERHQGPFGRSDR